MSEKAFMTESGFNIIESEVGNHHYQENEWVIVRRVIHATADFDFACKGKILFHRNALESAFNALRQRCTIVTDVDMVLAISKKSISDLGLKTVCYISDTMVAEQARRLSKTRSEIAMSMLLRTRTVVLLQ